MKRILCLLLALALLLCACGKKAPTAAEAETLIAGLMPEKAEEEPEPLPEAPGITLPEAEALSPEAIRAAGYLALPGSSREVSNILARQALLLCSGHTEENTAALLSGAGFELLTQKHFEKDDASPAHTCAFTVARKTVLFGGELRPLLLVAVRGTNAGEWYSNFDVSPAEDPKATFADNFLLCAEDAMETLRDYAEKEDDPLFLLCGHSRGAACANLLGLLVNRDYGVENTFVYTYATPTTVHGSLPDGMEDSNIFNFLNPMDLVPQLPPADWGFQRAGTDILLPAPEGKDAPYADTMETLTGIAPDIAAYYGERHALREAGLSDDGLSAFEVFLLIARALSGQEEAEGGSSLDGLVSEESDLYPLATLLHRAAENDWARGKDILTAHLPDTYGDLLSEWAEQNP